VKTVFAEREGSVCLLAYVLSHAKSEELDATVRAMIRARQKSAYVLLINYSVSQEYAMNVL
jgi:hypothetical protein